MVLKLIVGTLAAMVLVLGTASSKAADDNYERPFCGKYPFLCAETVNLNSVNPEGQYVGHDEPEVLFYSDTPGSDNNAMYTLKMLLKDPPNLPIQDDYKVSAGINIRLRDELWDTFAKQEASTNDTYDFFLTRVRGFADILWKNLTFHTMVQFVNGLNFPENGAFGPGPTYFVANGNNQNPTSLQLVEISLQMKDLPITGFYLKGGRIGIQDGAEVLYGEPKIDWIKNERLSGKLVGTFDWSNIGRRYDGGTLGYGNSILDLNLFGASALQGGFDFNDGYKELNNVVVAGGTLTLKKDAIAPNTEFRIFNIFYFDNRKPAKDLAHGDLKINTTGASIVGVYDLGSGQIDLLLWFALQTGEFGNLEQRAFGFIGEIGYQLLQILWKPWLRLGVAYASGDDNPSDSVHGTFFNILPTNHGHYGNVDAFAFSNLEDYYFQLILTPDKKLGFTIDGHLFRLASNDEFWIGGSGAFNNQSFGYVFF